MNKRDILAIGVAGALTAAMMISGAGQDARLRGPLDSPLPTPTTTPKPLILTPSPTSTALTPRPPTPTPQPITATPGPCTIAIHERSATCKTAYYQPVTWTLGSMQVFTISSLFDATSRAVFASELRPGTQIVIAPRWQPARTISVITLTGQISSGNWLTPTVLAGFAPPSMQVELVHHRWHTPTTSYQATFYQVTADAQGRWTLNVPGGVLKHPRDYWQVRYTDGGVTHVNGVLTRRLIFPIVRRGS